MKNYFKRMTCLWGAILVIGQLYANQEGVLVSSVKEIELAIENKASQINLEDGIYHDLRIEVNYSGTENAKIKIVAQNPGRVVIAGNSHIELNGNYIYLSGFDFDKGHRDKKEALILVEGKHNRISHTRFRNYNQVTGVWIQLNGQYNQVDYCWFEGKTSTLI